MKETSTGDTAATFHIICPRQERRILQETFAFQEQTARIELFALISAKNAKGSERQKPTQLLGSRF